MKPAIILLILIMSVKQASSQVVAIQNDRQNILYQYLPNPLTIAAEGYKSKDLIVTTDNGKLEGAEGKFLITPTRIGKAHIVIKKKTARGMLELLGDMEFRVKSLPVAASLAGLSYGPFPKSTLCYQVALSASVYGVDICGNFKLISYNVMVKRNGVEIFTRLLSDTNGTRIDSVTHAFFETLQDGDKLIFGDITMLDISGEPRKLDPLEFIITEAEKFRLRNTEDSITVFDPITGEEKRIKNR